MINTAEVVVIGPAPQALSQQMSSPKLVETSSWLKRQTMLGRQTSAAELPQAGMVEPFTAGGNEFAMHGGKVVAEIALEALKHRKYTEKYLSRYQKDWEKTEDGKELYRIQKGMEVGLEMRRQRKLDPMIAFLYFYRKLADEAAKNHVYLAQRAV